jgi:hypothetical protein
MNAPKSLWKVVTLGFLPLLVNLQRRFTGPDEKCFHDDVDNEESVYPSKRKNIIRSIEIRGDIPDVESVSDISDSSYSSESDSSSAFDSYSDSDYTSDSSEWSAEDLDLHHDNSSRNTNEVNYSNRVGAESGSTTTTNLFLSNSFYDFARSTTTLSLSNSFYDFARNPKSDCHDTDERHLGMRMTRVTRLVKKFSRVVQGGDDCHHTV